MYNLKTALFEFSIVMVIIGGLAACVTTEQATDATDISVNAYITNEAVDVAQAVIGPFDGSDKVDAIQKEIADALKDGSAIVKLDDLYNRTVLIYNDVRVTAVNNIDNMTELQFEMLIVLDDQLIELSDKIKAFQAKNNDVELVKQVRTLSEILSITKTVLTLYGV